MPDRNDCTRIGQLQPARNASKERLLRGPPTESASTCSTITLRRYPQNNSGRRRNGHKCLAIFVRRTWSKSPEAVKSVRHFRPPERQLSSGTRIALIQPDEQSLLLVVASKTQGNPPGHPAAMKSMSPRRSAVYSRAAGRWRTINSRSESSNVTVSGSRYPPVALLGSYFNLTTMGMRSQGSSRPTCLLPVP